MRPRHGTQRRLGRGHTVGGGGGGRGAIAVWDATALAPAHIALRCRKLLAQSAAWQLAGGG